MTQEQTEAELREAAEEALWQVEHVGGSKKHAAALEALIALLDRKCEQAWYYGVIEGEIRELSKHADREPRTFAEWNMQQATMPLAPEEPKTDD